MELFLPLYRPLTVKYTHLYVSNAGICKYSCKHRNLGLKCEKENMYNSILDPGSS